MPTSDSGKSIASRNATTHGLFARDVVLPALGEDPQGYQQLHNEWTTQLVPRNLLEQHYVEKIAAASWRLRRLHRWQAQLFEDDTLTERERLERLDKVLRHETALHRQIDMSVKMLAKDAPQLYTRRLRDQVLEDFYVTERECREEPDTNLSVTQEVGNRLYQLRKATIQAANELSEAPIDAAENTRFCQNELPPQEAAGADTGVSRTPTAGNLAAGNLAGNCENEWQAPTKAAAPAPTGPKPSYEAQREMREALAPVPHRRSQRCF